MALWSLLLLPLFIAGLKANFSQDDPRQLVDYLAYQLNVQYEVIDCYSSSNGFTSKLTLTNVGFRNITSQDWEIYFNSIRMIEPSSIRPDGVEIGKSGLKIHHVNGVLFKIVPTKNFKGFALFKPVELEYNAEAWMVAYTDAMPNWYVTVKGAGSKIIETTKGESLSFVAPIDTEKQWKRSPADTYDPYTPEKRMEIQNPVDLGHAGLPIIPTPFKVKLSGEKIIDLSVDGWVIEAPEGLVDFEAKYLSSHFGGLPIVKTGDGPDVMNIHLEIGDVALNGEKYTVSGAYQLELSSKDIITITGVDAAGVLFGIQSLIALHKGAKDGVIENGVIVDYPRYGYRGLHVDIGRNFHGKDDMIKILDVMSVYKMNKFHLHVTDDEGWRLEIPGLPELTQVGATRCHDLEGDDCILPQLGSGPDKDTQGSGFLSVEDYREILKFANDRHIEVIPEFDVPGHAHAAIHAMLARYRKYKDSDMKKATEFLLTDLDDKSEYLSVQYFTDNAINPCIESSYNFMAHIIDKTIEMHQDIQPLRVFNFGGDEQPKGAWTKSPKCEAIGADASKLKEEFVYRLSKMVRERGLHGVYGWEDGLMNGETPFNRSRIATEDAVAYFWDNVWEWGRGQRSYIMANAGFKVVLSHATHLYFDHPYEPSPEERGYYWATRIVPTRKTHSYIPDNIYENMIVDGNGNKIDKKAICDQFGCTPLNEGAEKNILGIQGQLFSETVRTSEHLHYMVFPRMLALAERAWHKASWEVMSEGKDRDKARDEDWTAFSNSLGYRELSRLDSLGIHYQIPPPAATLDKTTGALTAKVDYPGLKIEYSITQGRVWLPYTKYARVPPGVTALLRTKSADGRRESRISRVEFKV